MEVVKILPVERSPDVVYYWYGDYQDKTFPLKRTCDIDKEYIVQFQTEERRVRYCDGAILQIDLDTNFTPLNYLTPAEPPIPITKFLAHNGIEFYTEEEAITENIASMLHKQFIAKYKGSENEYKATFHLFASFIASNYKLIPIED